MFEVYYNCWSKTMLVPGTRSLKCRRSRGFSDKSCPIEYIDLRLAYLSFVSAIGSESLDPLFYPFFIYLFLIRFFWMLNRGRVGLCIVTCRKACRDCGGSSARERRHSYSWPPNKIEAMTVLNLLYYTSQESCYSPYLATVVRHKNEQYMYMEKNSSFRGRCPMCATLSLVGAQQ